MNLAELNKVAEAMVAPGRGILAADESSGTIKKRFDAIGAESTADSRRDYREFLFRSSEAMSKYISGVILYDETIRQNAKDGTPLVKVIEAAGAIPGIKVDKGTTPLPFCPGELITEGLDGLGQRLAEYRGLGARFAKWRAVIDIGAGIPSYAAVMTNANALARRCSGLATGTAGSQPRGAQSVRSSPIPFTATSGSMSKRSGATHSRSSTGSSARSACARSVRRSAGATGAYSIRTRRMCS